MASEFEERLNARYAECHPTDSDRIIEVLGPHFTTADRYYPVFCFYVAALYLPDFDNYFCRDCRRIVHVRKGSPGFRECPTPGCPRPTGFGAFAKVKRPVRGPRGI